MNSEAEQKSRIRRVLTMMAWIAGALVVAATATLWFALGSLIAPAPSKIPTPEADSGLRSISFSDAEGARIHGWYHEASPAAACILLLHGLRSDRTQMFDRMKWLGAEGYATLAIDLFAHGESDGDRLTFGARESESVRAAVAWLRATRPNSRIAALGHSLGGAACLLGGEPITVDALILEAVYADIHSALRNRLTMRVGSLASLAAPLVELLGQWRLGLTLDALRPVDAIRNLRIPVLVISGERDRRTTRADTTRLFEAAAQPKNLWLVDKAQHVDLHRFARREYEARVEAFLLRHDVRP